MAFECGNKHTLYRSVNEQQIGILYAAGKSANEIAELVDVSSETVLRRLKKNGVEIRPRGHNSYYPNRTSGRKAHHVVLSTPAIEFIYGELLGDGSMRSNNPLNKTALFTYATTKKSYRDWLYQKLLTYGIGGNYGESLLKNKKINGDAITTYYYQSKTYYEFGAHYKKWYPEGIKIIPKDIRLTPLMARQWYIGDGHLSRQSRISVRSYCNIKLAACCFSENDLTLLIEELGRNGFNASIHKGGIICLPRDDSERFLRWIGPCPVTIYNYKWAV